MGLKQNNLVAKHNYNVSKAHSSDLDYSRIRSRNTLKQEIEETIKDMESSIYSFKSMTEHYLNVLALTSNCKSEQALLCVSALVSNFENTYRGIWHSFSRNEQLYLEYVQLLKMELSKVAEKVNKSFTSA